MNFLILKINKKVISNVTLAYNRNLLNMKVLEIFIEVSLYFSNQSTLKEICKEGKDIDLKELINKTVRDCFEEYLGSENFLMKINNKFNEEYVETYKNYAINFIRYYLNNNEKSKSKKN